MRRATIQYNRRTRQYEVLVIGVGVRFRGETMDDALDWAEYNGYDLVEYD